MYRIAISCLLGLVLCSSASAELLAEFGRGAFTGQTSIMYWSVATDSASWVLPATQQDLGDTFLAPQEFVDSANDTYLFRINFSCSDCQGYDTAGPDAYIMCNAMFDGTGSLWLHGQTFVPQLGPSFAQYQITSIEQTITAYPINRPQGQYATILRIYGEEIQSIMGDYNQDGDVDASDFVMGRAAIARADGLPNSDDGGPANEEDIYNWQDNFGATAFQLPGGSGSSLVVGRVPEPRTSAIIFLIFAGCYLYFRLSQFPRKRKY